MNIFERWSIETRFEIQDYRKNTNYTYAMPKDIRGDDKMAKLESNAQDARDFLMNTEITSGNTLPEGSTNFEFSRIKMSEIEVEFGGQRKKRYLIEKDNGENYYVGVKVAKGMQKALKDGYDKVRVVRQGTDRQTSYVVEGVN